MIQQAIHFTASFFLRSGIILVSLLLTGFVSIQAAFSTPQQSLLLGQHNIHYHVVQGSSKKNKTSSSSQTHSSSKQTVMLLGGGPAFSSWNLEPIQKKIAAMGYTTLLMDMAGIGENAHVKPQKILDTWVKQIHLVLNKEAPKQDSITLVGHSWGALMAMLYQRQYPSNIEKVILLNPVDPEKKSMLNLTAEIDQRNRLEKGLKWDSEEAWEQKTDISINEVEAITLKQITQVLPTYFMDYQQGLAYAEQFTTQDFDIDLNIQTWKEYDQNPISYQTLQQHPSDYYFLECKQDYLMPYNLDAMSAKMTFKSVDLLDQCGHFPWIEQPDSFYSHLKTYLSD